MGYRSSLPKVLLLLALFVFFSTGTIHIVENDEGSLWASVDKNYRFDFDNAATRGLRLNLKSALVVDYTNGQVVYAKNADKQRPIASITKLMTVMVLLDHGVDLNSTETITKKDAYRSSKSRLRVGYELTIHDLIYAAMLNSDNRAARALARATCGSQEDFALEMNKKARELGLKNTYFVEPTGLDKRNVSTAHEVARLLHYAYDYKLIAKISSTKNKYVRVINKKNKKLQMANTNLMVHSRHKVLAGKTGYIRAADYCLTTLVKNKKGEMVTVVVLGVPGDKLRFREARKLADYGFKKS